MADGGSLIGDTPEELVIRLATPDDVDEVMNIAVLASDENGFLKAVPERLLREIWAALSLDHGMIGVIGAPGGLIEGAVLLRIGAMWYAAEDDVVLEEKAIFIHPSYRQARGGRAARLCEFSKRMANELGLPLIIGVLSNSRTRAKVKLYERQFGAPAGAFFLYNAKTGSSDVG